MNPPALMTGVKAAPEGGTMVTIDPSQHDALTAATTAVDDLKRWLGREQKAGRVLSATNMTKVDGRCRRSAMPSPHWRNCWQPPSRPRATRQCARHSISGARSPRTTYLSPARAAAVFWSRRLDYRPGQKPTGGAGHRMSLAISP